MITKISKTRNGSPFLNWKLGIALCLLSVPSDDVFGANKNLFLSNNSISEIQNSISGKVFDSSGQPLAGVTVREKGTSNSTSTKIDGSYTINVSSSTSVLTFAYMGYNVLEVSASNAKHITLVPNADEIEEVVVIGFGTQKKKDLTGAISQVGSDVIGNRPVSNLGQALQGTIPNLNVGFSNGSPNTNASFNVRGTTSVVLDNGNFVSSNGSPLVLIDGVPGDINRINPEDVETVTVLKDAASAAIYGARAAFGVILVTTKTGKAGKSQVDYSNSFQWSSPTAVPDILNSEAIQEAIVKGSENRGLSASSDDILKLEKIREYLKDPLNVAPYYINGANNVVWIGNTNPYDEALRKTAPMQKHNLSFSGGNEKTRYYTSLGYQNQDGIYKINNDNLKRYNAMLNLSSQVNDWFNMGFRSAYNNSTYNEPRNPSGKGGWWTAMSQEPNRNVFLPMKTPANSPVGEMYTDNILSFMDYGATTRDANEVLTMTVTPKLTLLSGWNIQSDISYKKYNDNTKEVVPLLRRIETNWNTTTAHTDPSYIYRYDYKSNQYTINLFTDYTKRFGEHHNFSGLLGYNQEWLTDSYMEARRNDINPSVPTIGQAQGVQTVGDGEAHWSVRGLFYRLTYDYKGKYLFQSNGRYDGTSRFSKDTRFHFFPSFSAGWVVSQEDFAERMRPYVNFLKLRGSYGSLGNQNVANYAYILSYSTSSNLNYLFDGARPNYINPPGLVDANLTWETAATIDFGFDASLFNKLDVTFDWYKRTTSDILAPRDQLPVILGSAEPLSNSGEIETKGWELSMTYRNESAGGFKYSLTGTLGDYQSEVSKFNGNKAKLLSALYEGMSVGEIWGFETVGIFQDQAEIDAAPKQTKINSGIWYPGDIRYADLNGDGEISTGANTVENPGDRRVIGNSTPRFSYGLNTNLSYKNFDFNLFLQGVAKRDVWVSNNLFWGAGTTGTYEVYNDSWTPERTNAYYPLYYNATKNRNTQTRYMQNGAYLRIKNVSIGYTLPTNLSEIAKLHKFRIFASAFNLFEFKSLPETFDPELLGMNYPIMRSYALGLQVTF